MRKCVFSTQHCFETRSHQITNHDACTFAFYIIIHYTRRLTLILCHIHTHIQRTNRISEANCATTRTWASFCSRFPHELHPRVPLTELVPTNEIKCFHGFPTNFTPWVPLTELVPTNKITLLYWNVVSNRDVPLEHCVRYSTSIVFTQKHGKDSNFQTLSLFALLYS